MAMENYPALSEFKPPLVTLFRGLSISHCKHKALCKQYFGNMF